MMRRIFKNQRGQTSVEYILLIAVAVSFGLTFFKKMDEYLLKNPNGLIGAPIKSFSESFDPAQGYKRFPLKLYR